MGPAAVTIDRVTDPIRLTPAEARRVALAAQGFDRPRPARVTLRHLTGVIDRLALLQIDSVNVVERAHLVPLFSRLGGYDRALVDRATTGTPRRLVEAWAHEASFVRPDVYHLLAWRRAQPERFAWHSIRRAPTDQPDVVAAVRDLVAERGPLTARQTQAHFARTHPHERGDEWGWSWSAAKTALEYLFFVGELGSAGRTASFERRYDLAERVVPPPSPALPTDPAGQCRDLIEIAARAHGLGTAHSLGDYFRLPSDATRRAIAELTEAGRLLPAQVVGWSQPVWLHVDARLPRHLDARALLVAFDPLLFDRARLERLFDFRFRLEYYVPAAQREFGYFVMPFLLGQSLAARVDLKADRAGGRLLVRAAHLEATQTVGVVAPALAEELRALADWLGLDDVTVESDVGELAPALRRSFSVTSA